MKKKNKEAAYVNTFEKRSTPKDEILGRADAPHSANDDGGGVNAPHTARDDR